MYIWHTDIEKLVENRKLKFENNGVKPSSRKIYQVKDEAQ